MTALFINGKLLHIFERTLYGNGFNQVNVQNEKNHAIILEELGIVIKKISDSKNHSFNYLPDKHSEYNGLLLIRGKSYNIRTCHISNLYSDGFGILYDAYRKPISIEELSFPSI